MSNRSYSIVGRFLWKGDVKISMRDKKNVKGKFKEQEKETENKISIFKVKQKTLSSIFTIRWRFI